MKKSSLSEEHGFVGFQSSECLESHIIEVYERHIDTVYRICFSLMGNKQDAEDATQSVFIQLMESNKSFGDTEHEKAWLIVIARNKCLDLHRKWWRKKVVHYDSNSMDRIGTGNLLHSDLEENLRKLPFTYRLILYLYYYEGYKLAEIAVMLKMNINTLKTKMRNAKKRLKVEMGGDFSE